MVYIAIYHWDNTAEVGPRICRGEMEIEIGHGGLRGHERERGGGGGERNGRSEREREGEVRERERAEVGREEGKEEESEGEQGERGEQRGGNRERGTEERERGESPCGLLVQTIVHAQLVVIARESCCCSFPPPPLPPPPNPCVPLSGCVLHASVALCFVAWKEFMIQLNAEHSLPLPPYDPLCNTNVPIFIAHDIRRYRHTPQE